jgi:hypothetical protein
VAVTVPQTVPRPAETPAKAAQEPAPQVKAGLATQPVVLATTTQR